MLSRERFTRRLHTPHACPVAAGSFRNVPTLWDFSVGTEGNQESVSRARCFASFF